MDDKTNREYSRAPEVEDLITLCRVPGHRACGRWFRHKSTHPNQSDVNTNEEDFKTFRSDGCGVSQA